MVPDIDIPELRAILIIVKHDQTSSSSSPQPRLRLRVAAVTATAEIVRTRKKTAPPTISTPQTSTQLLRKKRSRAGQTRSSELPRSPMEQIQRARCKAPTMKRTTVLKELAVSRFFQQRREKTTSFSPSQRHPTEKSAQQKLRQRWAREHEVGSGCTSSTTTAVSSAPWARKVGVLF